MREFALPNYPQAVTYHRDVQKNSYNNSFVCFGHRIRTGGFLRNKIKRKKEFFTPKYRHTHLFK